MYVICNVSSMLIYVVCMYVVCLYVVCLYVVCMYVSTYVLVKEVGMCEWDRESKSQNVIKRERERFCTRMFACVREERNVIFVGLCDRKRMVRDWEWSIFCEIEMIATKEAALNSEVLWSCSRTQRRLPIIDYESILESGFNESFNGPSGMWEGS